MAFQPGDLIESSSGTRYILHEPLGSGFSGTVWSANSLNLKTSVALKFVPYSEGYLPEIMAHIYLSQSPHCSPNITCLYDAFLIEIADSIDKISEYIVLALELMDGDLQHKLVTDDEIPFIMVSILDGIATVHHEDFSHQDVFTRNILYRDHNYKIGDLGEMCSRHKTASRVEIATPTGRKELLNPDGRSLMPMCKELYKYRREIDENSAFERAKQSDIYEMGRLLDNIIFSRPSEFGPSIITEPYPRQEPDIISGEDIIYLVNRMLTKDWSIDQLRDYFYSRLKYPLVR